MKTVKKERSVNTRELIFCGANILIPLLAGAAIYVWISQDSYFGNWICSLLPISKVATNSGIWMFLRNWGGDFLWAYALFFALYLATRTSPNAFLITIVFASMTESLQLIQIDFLKSGTFDVLDIAIEVLAVCIGRIILYLYHYYKIKKQKENVS